MGLDTGPSPPFWRYNIDTGEPQFQRLQEFENQDVALSPDELPLKVGVTGDSEAAARSRYAVGHAQWRSLLDKEKAN